MGKGNTFIGELLDHVFLNANLPLIGDATGLLAAATAGSFYFAIHTADPGAAGSQTTSECAYGAYARVAVARTAGGFTRTSQQVTNAADVNFPTCTSGSETASHWSIGTASSGAGKVCYSGPLCSGIKIFVAATSDTLTVPGNAFVVDNRVVFFAVPNVSLPTGITAGTIYWVKTVSGDAITISATQGGATLDITAVGGGKIALAAPLAISSSITPKITAGTMVLAEA